MAISLIKRFAVCIVFMISITIFQQLHLQKSLFINGHGGSNSRTQIEDDRSCQEKIRCNGIELINRGVTMLYPNITIEGRYYKALKEFYDFMSNDPMAFSNIINHLEKEFNDTIPLMEKGMSKFKNTEYENSSHALLVYLYTTKSNYSSIYYTLNSILRNHLENCNNKSITGTDENIAPYAAALSATLLYWDRLTPATEITYRGINRNIRYQNDSIIILISFTSSSLDRKQAWEYGNKTFYTITNDNQTNPMWQPKLVYNFSAEPNEQEALYPPGSVFKKVSDEIIGEQISYNTTLLDQQNEDDCTIGYPQNPVHSTTPNQSGSSGPTQTLRKVELR